MHDKIQEITNEVTQFTNEEDGAALFLENKFLNKIVEHKKSLGHKP